ncbi:MAG: ribulose-phosphate 3-epimerase [Spirochaetes bacterium]|uniref:Ribulose-phosphate 3-epimerase n=1 Tax=Candidatus Ornithospirochaeta stercoripullorum TaxID=2840899 RepID=A0A9D9DYN2_9SPIO|nr:ribulose-phosphate 3-epimerase [Candidatus Ornithospirochaeta stercoripullorum]
MRQSSLMYAPSILGGDFSRAGEELRAIASSGADYAHFDVMDGSFVPEITFGAKFIEDCRHLSDLIFDVHLMIDNPERHIERFAKAGCDRITVHAEASKHIWRVLAMIKEAGKEAGIAINPGTSVSSIEPVLSFADYVLVMTVNPGYGGQRFITQMIDKIEELDSRRTENGWSYLIGADGGISSRNIKTLYDKGLDLAVMGSSFFAEEDKAAYIKELDAIIDGSVV